MVWCHPPGFDCPHARACWSQGSSDSPPFLRAFGHRARARMGVELYAYRLRRGGDPLAHRMHGRDGAHRAEPAQEGNRAQYSLPHDGRSTRAGAALRVAGALRRGRRLVCQGTHSPRRAGRAPAARDRRLRRGADVRAPRRCGRPRARPAAPRRRAPAVPLPRHAGLDSTRRGAAEERCCRRAGGRRGTPVTLRTRTVPLQVPAGGLPQGTVRDKRIVTLVYTDMEGSTRLLGALQDAFLPVLERQREILGAATAAHGGAGYATGGDGCVFLFGSPSSAVAAAVEAQRALAVERWPEGVSVRVRMAIHAGEVADLGDELFGMALYHVSRMLGVTHGGQVLLSGAAVGLLTELPPGIALRDLGPHRLRDVVRPVQLHQAVAEGIPDSFPPVPAAMSRAGTLPAATTFFVGRERQLQELVDLLAVRRLVTLTGAGGSGKTRLALEVARHVQGAHRDGVRLVELAGLGNTELMPGAVLGALGMREPPAGTSATEALCAALADRALLLVLDNCEQVVGGVAALVSALLPACAGLHVLATSREPLRVSGEVERLVPPLGRPAASATEPLDRLAAYDAVRLLLERGADVRPGFRLTDGNATAVARLCAALEGLPLAIELVAARLRTQSPEQLAAKLGDQLDLLTDGGRTRPDRQQTMRATLDWSHDLLTADEQIVFRRLSIFAGGFTLEAAADVTACGGVTEAQVIDAIERLASKSLIEVDHEREEPRLRMLEPVRQYAAERLREAGERDEIVRRHLDWVVRFAVRAGLRFLTEQRHWTLRLRDEQDNVREALEASFSGVDREAALRITGALGDPWFAMGQPDGRAWVVRALEAAPDAPDLRRAPALWGAGMLEENALDFPGALRHLREALALSRTCGARALEAWVLMAMGRAAWWIDVDGRPAGAWFADALHIFREVGEQAGVGWMLALLASESYDAGDRELAASQFVEALEIGTASGVLE